MEKYAIRGGNPLVGEVEIGGAKNAALAILAAAVMTDETVLIENMPDVRDTNILLQAMESIGTIVERVDRHTVKINGSRIHNLVISDGYVKKIAPLCKSVVTVTPSNPRALNGEALKGITEKYCDDTKFISNPKEGFKYILLNTKEEETALICGSFYLMSDIFTD